MAKAVKVKQIDFMMPDRTGLLSEVAATLKAAKVNITAICAYGMDNVANFIMITDGNAAAKKVLKKMGGEVKEADVIAVEMANKVGEIQKVADVLAAAGINIFYTYGTAGAGKTPMCVFHTSDNKKAIKLINK